MIFKAIILLVLVLNPIVISADALVEPKSENLDALDSDESEPLEHENPDAYGYPDIRKAYIPPDVTPVYAYFPSPDDDGTYIKVLMQEEFFPPGAPGVPGPEDAAAAAALLRPRVDFYLYTK